MVTLADLIEAIKNLAKGTDVTSPAEMRQEVGEALREETQKYGIVKTFPHPELSLNEVSVIFPHVDGKIYVGVGPAGEFWSWDGEEWTLEYTYPHAATSPSDYNWRLTAWVAEVFGGNLYFGGKHWVPGRPCIVRFDGTNWTVIALGTGVAEVYGLIAHYVGGQWWLYAATGDEADGNGKIYRSSDGVNWAHIYTAVGVQLRTIAVYNSRLYVGNSSNNLYYTIDGTTFLTVPVGGSNYHIKSFDGLLYIARNNTEICTYNGAAVTHLCSFRNFSGVVDLNVISNKTLIASLREASNTVIGLGNNNRGYCEIWATNGYTAFPSGFRKIFSLPSDIIGLGHNPALVFGRVMLGTSFWRSYTKQKQRYMAQVSVREDYTPTLLACDLLNFLTPTATTPSTFNLWENQVIGAAEETDPIPIYGFKNTDIYFKSNANGTLTILVDVRGNGTFETYDTMAIVANVFTPYPMTGHPIYLKLRFSAIATVTARVACS